MNKIKKFYKSIPEGKVKGFMAKIYEKKSRLSHMPKLPSFVQIEPTTRCNLDCTMCMRKDFIRTGNMKMGDMSFDKFKIIAEKIPSMERIDFQGVGEPFLNTDTVKMIKYSTDLGKETFAITNGTMIGSMSEDIVKSNLDLLKISFYSPDKFGYAKIMKNSNLNLILKNIDKINRVKRNIGSTKPVLEICTGVLEENLKDLPKLPELLHKIGVSNLSIGEIYGTKNPITLKGIEKIIKEVKKKSAEHKIKTNVNISKDIYDYTKKCIWPWVATYITWDGYVKPCCSRPYFLDFDFGNIFKEDFKEIWNSEKYVSFRKSLRSKNVPLMCRGCQYDFSAFDEKNGK